MTSKTLDTATEPLFGVDERRTERRRRLAHLVELLDGEIGMARFSADGLTKARLYAGHLIEQGIAKREDINGACYPWFIGTLRDNEEYAEECAKVFSWFGWKYWLPEKVYKDRRGV